MGPGQRGQDPSKNLAGAVEDPRPLFQKKVGMELYREDVRWQIPDGRCVTVYPWDHLRNSAGNPRGGGGGGHSDHTFPGPSTCPSNGFSNFGPLP